MDIDTVDVKALKESQLLDIDSGLLLVTETDTAGKNDDATGTSTGTGPAASVSKQRSMFVAKAVQLNIKKPILNKRIDTTTVPSTLDAKKSLLIDLTNADDND